MHLTEAATSYLAHRILEAVKGSGAGVRNDRLALQEIKAALVRQVERDPRVDEAVRRRIASLTRRPPPGSAEYEVLYRQYYEQEQRKRRP